MPHHDIRIKQVQPIRALTLRFLAQNHLHFARVVAEIRAAARAQSVRASAHPIQITYADSYRQNNVDTEFALPVADARTARVPLATFGTMTVRELPEAVAASYIHTGSPDSLNDGLAHLQGWVAAHGYKLSGSMRMIYLRGLVEPLPVGEWVFEVQYPLETT
jgi:effector-binding domain-containing protein